MKGTGSTDRRIILHYVLLCGGPGAIGSFSALWLQTQGYAPAEAGHTIGMMLCLAVGFNMAIGLGARNIRYLSIMPNGLCLLCAAAGAVMMFAPAAQWPVRGWVMASLALSACLPLIDASNLALATRRATRFYTRRGAASAAYMGGSC